MLLLLLACTPTEPTPATPAPIQVDPMIGTGGPGYRVGSATPAAGLPFGLVKVGPDTTTADGGMFPAYHCSGYYYDDTHIAGFSHFHLHGTGAEDYGNLLFVPQNGFDGTLNATERIMSFSHAQESAAPGWYRVQLDNGITTELSATRHSAHHRYTFPETDRALLIDLSWNIGGQPLYGEIHIQPESGIIYGVTETQGSFTGGGFPLYFYAVVDGGFQSFGTWADGQRQDGQSDATGTAVGGWIVPNDSEVSVRVGISLTSQEEAQKNLEAELPEQTWEETRDTATALWDTELSRFSITGGTESQQTIFWTAIYHALQMPNEHGDADGSYRGFDGEVHQAVGWTYHSDMSLWDTYRTAHPLYNLAWPEKARDFAASLVHMAQEGGAFPRWPVVQQDGGSMLGAPADIVLADTYLRGVKGWGEAEAWPLLVEQATVEAQPYNGRPGISWVEEKGWIPDDLYGSSVAWQMELSWADHALARLGGALGMPGAAHFLYRSVQYRNLFDPALGFFHGRHSDGSFNQDFDEMSWLDEYTEGNAWQYLWLAPHDPEGLATLLGGPEAARAQLETFMQGLVDEGILALPQSYYWHGNEPDIHAPFLFALWGDRDRAVYWSRWIEENLYHVAPDGLAGNDDAGTLSAWYIFSTMGLYPIAGTDQYIVTAPLFEEISVAVTGGRFTVRREGSGTHIVSQTLDGMPISGPTLSQSEIRAGRVLVVSLAAL